MSLLGGITGDSSKFKSEELKKALSDTQTKVARKRYQDILKAISSEVNIHDKVLQEAIKVQVILTLQSYTF